MDYQCLIFLHYLDLTLSIKVGIGASPSYEKLSPSRQIMLKVGNYNIESYLIARKL